MIDDLTRVKDFVVDKLIKLANNISVEQKTARWMRDEFGVSEATNNNIISACGMSLGGLARYIDKHPEFLLQVAELDGVITIVVPPPPSPPAPTRIDG